MKSQVALSIFIVAFAACLCWGELSLALGQEFAYDRGGSEEELSPMPLAPADESPVLEEESAEAEQEISVKTEPLEEVGETGRHPRRLREMERELQKLQHRGPLPTSAR